MAKSPSHVVSDTEIYLKNTELRLSSALNLEKKSPKDIHVVVFYRIIVWLHETQDKH